MPHIFLAVLINSQMHGPKRAPSNLLLDDILIDAVHGSSVIFAIRILGVRVQCLFDLARL